MSWAARCREVRSFPRDIRIRELETRPFAREQKRFLQGVRAQRPPPSRAGNTCRIFDSCRGRHVARAHLELTGTARGASAGALGSTATSSELTIIAAGIGLSVVDESIDGIRKSGGVACEPVALST